MEVGEQVSALPKFLNPENFSILAQLGKLEEFSNQLVEKAKMSPNRLSVVSKAGSFFNSRLNIDRPPNFSPGGDAYV